MDPCVPGSNLRKDRIFFIYLFFLFIYFFFGHYYYSANCKFANSTLLSLLSLSYFITPYDAQASSAFSALISIGTLSMCKHPQILFIRPSKTDRIMSCPPPVFPSVNFRVRTITDTVQDIFMKLGTNINHYQTSAENKSRYSINILWNYGSLNFFLFCVRSIILIPFRIFL